MAHKPKAADGDDRSGTNLFLFGAGAASIAFNVWFAHSIYDGLAAMVFAFGILCVEVAAWLSLKHILRDWDNNHRVKPGVALAIFGAMVIVCFFMGWRAFETKNIEIAESNKIAAREAKAFEDRAKIHFDTAAAAVTKATAATAAGDRATADKQRSIETTEAARGRTEQSKADALRLEIKKNQEVPKFFVVVILIALEGIKMFGRWAIATPSAKIWAPERRAAEKEKQKAREAEAKAARIAAEGGKHLKAVSST